MKPTISVGTKLAQGIVSAILNNGVEVELFSNFKNKDGSTKTVLTFAEAEAAAAQKRRQPPENNGIPGGHRTFLSGVRRISSLRTATEQAQRAAHVIISQKKERSSRVWLWRIS
jgi:hypothetical protein